MVLSRTYQEEFNQDTSWNAPLVAFADAYDPMFAKLREVVRPSHAMPDAIKIWDWPTRVESVRVECHAR